MTRSEVVVAIKLLLWTFLLKSSLALYANKASINFKTSANLNSLNSVRAVQLPVGKAIYEQYTLGQMEEGAKIIYTYQTTEFFDEEQEEISMDFHYPIDAFSNDEDENLFADEDIITQIQLYVKAEDGASTQAYITEGGIGKKNISLQIIANHSKMLNYMLVIYGTNALK